MRTYLGQHKCCACDKLVRVYDWLPNAVYCAKHRDEIAKEEARGGSAARSMRPAPRKKFKVRLKAEPVGFTDPSPSPSTRFEQTADERLMLRAQLRTQKALLGQIGPRASYAYACVFGAALLCVEAGVGLKDALDAFSEEHRRVSKEWDKWKLGEHERLKAEVGLVKAKGKSEEA
jgi:hypothetical protein